MTDTKDGEHKKRHVSPLQTGNTALLPADIVKYNTKNTKESLISAELKVWRVAVFKSNML